MRLLRLTASLLLILAGFFVTATAIIAQDSQVYRTGNGVSVPRVIKQVMPGLTPEAMRAEIRGTVLLAAVVREDGTVADVKVTRSSFAAKYGMDNEAVKAAKQWTFSPGMKDGKPVAVAVSIEMAFNCVVQSKARGPADYSKPSLPSRLRLRASCASPWPPL